MPESLRDSTGLLADLQQLAALDGFRNVPLSAGTRDLLCLFASGDLERPLPDHDTDWDEVYLGCCRNGLLGLAQRYLSARGEEERPAPSPLPFRRMIARAQGLTGLRLAMLRRELGTTLRGLVDAGLDPIVLKGPALGQIVYPEPALRPFGDLDLLLRERDVLAAHRALLAQGFEAEHDPSSLPPRLVPQLTVYELQYWHRERQLLVEIHIDDPFNTGLTARDLDGYWRRAVPVTIGGVAVKVLSLNDQVLQLCAHAHYHGYTRLIWLSDLAFIVRDHGSSLDWSQISTLTRVEALEVPVYYSLHLLEKLLAVHVPADVLTALRPDAFRRWWHEYYLPEWGIASLDSNSRPFTGFFFVPFLRRLLPDMLVMGRRREKFRCLLRLLIPPPSWLRAYYQLTDKQAVAPQYLLHPLKFLAHALAEIVRATGGSRASTSAARQATLVPPWSTHREAARLGSRAGADIA